MKWLVDHNVHQGVFRILEDAGIEAATAEFLGLESLKNGALVRKASELGFTSLLTQDTTFALDASRALRENPAMCIIVIDTRTLPQSPGGRAYLQRFADVFKAEPIRPVPGQLIRWPTKPYT